MGYDFCVVNQGGGGECIEHEVNLAFAN